MMDQRFDETEAIKKAEEIEKTEAIQKAEAVEKAEREAVERRKEKKKKEKKNLTGSFPAKVLAFFLLAASSFVATVSVCGCVYALAEEFYVHDSADEIFMEVSNSQLINAAWMMYKMIQEGRSEREIRDYFSELNLDVNMLRNEEGEIVWGTYDGTYDAELFVDYYISFDQDVQRITIGTQSYYISDNYLFRVYVNPELPNNDSLRQIYLDVSFLHEQRYTMIWTALAGSVLTILCFLFLMCGSGHSNKRKEEQDGAFQGFFLDVLAGIFLLGLAAIVYVFEDFERWLRGWEILPMFLLIGVTVTSVVVWLTLCLCEAARSVKRGKFWRHTLIYVILRLCFRLLKTLCRGFVTILQGIPTILTTLIVFLGITIVEFMGCLFFVEVEGVMLWALEKLILLPIVVYVALICGKLLKASEALAEGDQNYVLDTSRMFGDLKTHGENLNSISQGISKAVAEQMKSEHLKTELITNVSHDLKTPLTSIINYSNLICEEKTENEKITEYAQVLSRQSGRLKKLLEDLVEASKATTGNLEVNLVPCEVGVLLSQAVGEYQQRMEEKALDLIASWPEEPVRIMADGRHLWRVFDNLLNNICKYAQENSRVYLSVELLDEEVRIIFRNMSKYALNISPEELEERFVRGDKSRHMDGNGLGLSIARSLMDLQNGKMEIVTDGDLFKVTLRFRRLK